MADTRSYWTQTQQSRLSRRRLLKAGPGLSLIGCGGDKDAGDASGLLYKPVDSTA